MRAQFLWLSLFATPAAADVWQLHPELGLSAADVSMSSTGPEIKSHASSKALNAGLRLLREDNDSLWESSGSQGIATAGGKEFAESMLRSHYLRRAKQSVTNYELTYRRSRGFNPLNPLIEDAVTGVAQNFQTISAGIYHQGAFDATNQWAVYVGGGENRDGSVRTQARDAQLSWDHQHTVLWTSRLRARYAEAETKQHELIHEHLIRLSPKLSTQLSYGYGWQQTEEGNAATSHGALWGAALLFQTSGIQGPESAYQSVAPVLELTEEQVEGMRGTAMYTVGWAHSRDRRRVGDPYYYADMLYGSTKFDVFVNQTLEAKASQSRATQEQFVESQSSYRSELLSATYAVRHRFWSRYPDAALALTYRTERTEFSPQSFTRESFEASYGLVW